MYFAQDDKDLARDDKDLARDDRGPSREKLLAEKT
jgi:hypothetical protein